MVNLNWDLIDKIIKHFKEFLEDEGKKWESERREKDKFFEENFSKDKIGELDEGVIRTLLHKLWAYYGWTNKDYLLKEIMKSGIDIIKENFDYLLHSDEKVSNRFDKFQNSINRMGSAATSEILAHLDHDNFSFYNRRSKDALIALGVEKENIPKYSQITGEQYVSFCKTTKEVLEEITEKHKIFKDLFTLDFLLYYISKFESKITSPDIEEAIKTAEDFDHDEIIEHVLELGDGLGFEVDDEVKIVKGCQIDALWKSRVANLGIISYAFEVHKSGSRDSAILNLQRVNRDPQIQKVIIVSSEKELDIFEDEIASLDEDFRNAVSYFSVDDLQVALDHLGFLKDILNELGLMPK